MSVDANHKFIYTPLKSARQEIRLLSITKSESVEVECWLEHASLEENTSYEALSYTWGDPSDVTSIRLNGRHFTVTRSLAAALQCLRGEGYAAKIWIDAVSINQQNDAEKSVQVRQMREIFEKAKKVIIWLGQEADDSSHAISVMKNISWPEPPNQHGIPVPNMDERSVVAIEQLLRRPWWSRVWTIQEATCANDTYFKCGNDEMEFSPAAATARFMIRFLRYRPRSHIFPRISHFRGLISLERIKRTRQQLGHCSNLLELIDETRRCKASDPRDKVFSLSGLAQGAQREAGYADYSIPVDEAYIRFTHRMASLEHTLDILGFCQEKVRSPQSWSTFQFLHSSLLPKQPLPYWTPDWTLQRGTTPFFKNEIDRDTLSKRIYKADDNYLPSIRLAEDLRTLFIRGSVFDMVSKTGEAFDFELNPLAIQSWYSWIETEPGRKYHNNETMQEAFLHTLVADITIEANRVRHGKNLAKRVVRGGTAPWPIHNVQNDIGFIGSPTSVALGGRRFSLSKQGYMGLVRRDVREGDKICILHGGQVPFILREDGDTYIFKGECYVHGLMDGEGMRYPTVWQDFAVS